MIQLVGLPGSPIRHSSHEELMAAVRTLTPRALVAFSGTAPPELLALASLGPNPSLVLDEIRRQVVESSPQAIEAVI